MGATVAGLVTVVLLVAGKAAMQSWYSSSALADEDGVAVDPDAGPIDAKEAAWERQDDETRFGTVRDPKFENPDEELRGSGAGGRGVVEASLGGKAEDPEAEKEIESPATSETDLVVRLCGEISARSKRPGLHKSPTAVQYVHIPKAGGMSIQTAMWSWTRRAGLRYIRYDGPSVSGSSMACPARASEADVFSGHRAFGFCDAVMKKRNPFIFTVFREPLSRMVSQYDYNLKCACRTCHRSQPRKWVCAKRLTLTLFFLWWGSLCVCLPFPQRAIRSARRAISGRNAPCPFGCSSSTKLLRLSMESSC